VRLNIERRDVQRVLLDELAARLDLVAHQAREDLVAVGHPAHLVPNKSRICGSIMVSQNTLRFISPKPMLLVFIRWNI
jgi:hypothetical protein